MEIDWGKNNIFKDHSCLFQVSDLKLIPYYYVGDDGKMIVEQKRGYSKPLSEVKQRLDLLGYSLPRIDQIYNEEKKYLEALSNDFIDYKYTDFYNVISSINISEIDMCSDLYTSEYDLGEYARKCVLLQPGLKQLLSKDDYHWWFEEFLENLDPYITLRILAENIDNIDLCVTWAFADVVDNGWVSENKFSCELVQSNKILLVTEGSSDSFIIKRTIDQIYPCIADFFQFIDMDGNYPFTGTGNLYNFCQGLSKINIQNNVIVIFDNDAAGREKYNKAVQLEKPINLFFYILPDLDEMRDIQCIGPNGISHCDINGKAVSIECFLDFSSIMDHPLIRWTNYNQNLNCYQGVIEPKNQLVSTFKKNKLTNPSYNIDKLIKLIDHLINAWTFR